MKYLLLVHHDERAWARTPEAERQQVLGEFMQLRQQLMTDGQYISSAPLFATDTGKTVRVRNGARLVTDGPFAETREQLAGYYLIDVKDRDEALGIAARIPTARWGTIEVRPLAESMVPASAPA